jgi:hypothetical protein
MATRANLIVKDKYNTIQIYRHYDGYPKAVIPELSEALKFAWKLPRFEADDFAAAIVRAWKNEGGGHIRIDGNPKAFEMTHGDIEWLYIIKQTKDGKIIIEIYDWHKYWLGKADIDSKTFNPKPDKVIELKA